MVGGMIRHLHSLRLMRKDRGWIHTLLDEAENERMHLMTFMAMKKPGALLAMAIHVAVPCIATRNSALLHLLLGRCTHRCTGNSRVQKCQQAASCIAGRVMMCRRYCSAAACCKQVTDCSLHSQSHTAHAPCNASSRTTS